MPNKPIKKGFKKSGAARVLVVVTYALSRSTTANLSTRLPERKHQRKV